MESSNLPIEARSLFCLLLYNGIKETPNEASLIKFLLIKTVSRLSLSIKIPYECKKVVTLRICVMACPISLMLSFPYNIAS